MRAAAGVQDALGGGPQPPEVRGAAQRQVEGRLLVARRGLDVAVDQDPLQQSLVLALAKRMLRRVTQQATHGLCPLVRSRAVRQRAARQLARDLKVPQRHPDSLGIDPVLGLLLQRRDG